MASSKTSSRSLSSLISSAICACCICICSISSCKANCLTENCISYSSYRRFRSFNSSVTNFKNSSSCFLCKSTLKCSSFHSFFSESCKDWYLSSFSFKAFDRLANWCSASSSCSFRFCSSSFMIVYCFSQLSFSFDSNVVSSSNCFSFVRIRSSRSSIVSSVSKSCFSLFSSSFSFFRCLSLSLSIEMATACSLSSNWSFLLCKSCCFPFTFSFSLSNCSSSSSNSFSVLSVSSYSDFAMIYSFSMSFVLMFSKLAMAVLSSS
mmetsp:Transcript_12361/g.18455  ORF Transcript_12361/g.18455 Transcript_12361/m.18455 type:complete len:263 (+) Transcript_12361:941-1729(+)